jgi:tripartite-type tricarboxylate transporter receptor subunit TctC
MVSKAAPDGYNFFMGAAHHAIAPSLYPSLDFDIEKDFIAVALIARPPQVVVVNPDKIAAKTLVEFIDYARANPGKLTDGAAGAGTTYQWPDAHGGLLSLRADPGEFPSVVRSH